MSRLQHNINRIIIKNTHSIANLYSKKNYYDYKEIKDVKNK